MDLMNTAWWYLNNLLPDFLCVSDSTYSPKPFYNESSILKSSDSFLYDKNEYTEEKWEETKDKTKQTKHYNPL